VRVLITGVGGFVGSHAARACLARGWEVTGIRRRPASGAEPAGMKIVQTDLRELRGLPDRYDALLHCAAEIPARCPDAGQLYETNVGTTRALLAHAAAAGAKRAVCMSSMSVYGPVAAPVVDENSPLAASDAYGLSKIEGERLAQAWGVQPGRSAVSIRLPGVVGLGSHDNFLSGVIHAILADETVVARNPDGMFNNIVHMDELTAFLAGLLSEAPPGHVALTLAAEAPMRVDAVLDLMARSAGRSLRVEWREGGPPAFLIEFSLARRLGYRPATVGESVARFAAERASGQLVR
jgi:nucleoside-diphosphate-sugar epimerase